MEPKPESTNYNRPKHYCTLENAPPENQPKPYISPEERVYQKTQDIIKKALASAKEKFEKDVESVKLGYVEVRAMVEADKYTKDEEPQQPLKEAMKRAESTISQLTSKIEDAIAVAAKLVNRAHNELTNVDEENYFDESGKLETAVEDAKKENVISINTNNQDDVAITLLENTNKTNNTFEKNNNTHNNLENKTVDKKYAEKENVT